MAAAFEYGAGFMLSGWQQLRGVRYGPAVG